MTAATRRGAGALRFMRRILGAVRRRPGRSLLVAALALVAGTTMWMPSTPDYGYVDAAVTRGPVVRRVAASGKLRARNTIKVGTEVSGQVAQVLVDFNATVRQGQILAVIDPTRFRARVRQLEAQVLSARAALSKAEAARAKSLADLSVQRRDEQRRRSLRAQGFVSDAALDEAAGRHLAAQATARDADAQIDAARAQIEAAQAELAAARLDLLRTVIVAPTAGVVIDKLVEPGATVAATFQTPTLFEIASDLTLMQVEATIDEADIGEVHMGQPVSFTVDAYPGRSFAARVQQIRKAATETRNVVSYLAILSVDNRDGALLPGMTANVSIVTGARAQVTRVPAAALSFAPRGVASGEDAPSPTSAARDLWVRTAAPLRPERRRVGLGLRGEDHVEIVSGLRAGEAVLTGIRSTNAGADPAKDAADE